jgi:arylsulfatase A
LLKIELPDSLELHGRSLLPLLIDDDEGDDRFMFTHQVQREFDTIPGAVRSNQYLLTLYPKNTALYDLSTDPFQSTDLSKELPQIASDYLNRYAEWFNEVTENGIEPPLIQVGYDIVPEVEFPAPDCEKYGALTFEGGMGWANDWLKGWQDEKDSAVWKFNSVEEQSYNIFLELSNTTPADVIVLIDDHQYKLSLREATQAPVIPNHDRLPRTEVEERSWPQVKLGTVKIPKGIHRLKVFTLTTSNLELKSVILKKV